MFAARYYIMNVDAQDLTAVRDKLLQVPNMNTTGRLPAVLLIHIKMQVRITVSDERPATSTLLADPGGQTKERRVAQPMFEDQDYVCELKTIMRFRGDPALSSILLKMRTLGDDRSNLCLTEEEWRVLQSVGVAHGPSLEGQSCGISPPLRGLMCA